MSRLTRLLAVLCAAVALLPACSATHPEPVTLRVLASSELADLAAAITAADARRPVSIVLMTDGLSNTGLTADDFLARHRTRGSPVPTFAIRVGEADAAELTRAATATGGHLVDAGADALPAAFKEIRGCR